MIYMFGARRSNMHAYARGTAIYSNICSQREVICEKSKGQLLSRIVKKKKNKQKAASLSLSLQTTLTNPEVTLNRFSRRQITGAMHFCSITTKQDLPLNCFLVVCRTTISVVTAIIIISSSSSSCECRRRNGSVADRQVLAVVAEGLQAQVSVVVELVLEARVAGRQLEAVGPHQMLSEQTAVDKA